MRFNSTKAAYAFKRALGFFLLWFICLQPMYSQLIAHWRFNGNGTDETGNHNITVSNSSMYIASTDKEGSHYLSFDGSGYYVNCGSITFGTQFTITGWIKTWNSSSDERPIISNSTYSTPNGFALLINESAKGLRFITGNGSTSTEANTSTALWSAGDWVHFAIVVNKTTNTCQIFVNGVNQTSASSVYSGFSTGGSIYLGQDTNGTTAWCYADDIHFYNCALTSTDINSIMSTYNSVTCGTTQYTLSTTISPSGSGTISFSPSGGTYAANTVVTVTATQNSGYAFSAWSGDLSGSTNPATITMSANKTITATFTTISNQAPVVSNVNITGSAIVGQVLTGNYTYSDAENNPQGTSTYKWYRADNTSGTNQAQISGATSQNYTVTATDQGKYIRFEVTPVATTGTSPGTTIQSSYTGPVTTSSYANWMTNGNNIYYNLGKVSIGTSVADPSSALTVNGKILATEVEVVSSITSDFVFDPSYKVMPLTELEMYLKIHKHLPGVPSAGEFAEKGQNLGETDDILLRKIEELSLYIIEQEKMIKKMKEDIEQLKRNKNM